jgi:hypothetical protein
MTYTIKWLYDEHDCETCGWSQESGYSVLKDGVEVIKKEPIAHCFGSIGYDSHQAFLDILNLEEVKVSQEGL